MPVAGSRKFVEQRFCVSQRGDVVVLRFPVRGAAQEQHVRLAWTRCRFGW